MEINFTLLRQNRRTLSIYIQQNGDVLVKAPKNMPYEKIQGFVMQKSGWIVKKQQTAFERTNLLPQLKTGEKLQIAGQEYTLNLYNGIKTCENNNVLYLPNQSAKSSLKQFCALKFKNYLLQKVTLIASQNGFKFNGIRLSNASKRWGSCSAQNNLSFNISLCLLPESVIEYVIYHELCHIREKNHGKRFYALLQSLLPDYKQRVQDLKNYSAFCAFF